MPVDRFSFLRDRLRKALALPWFIVLACMTLLVVRDRTLWLFSRRSGVGDGPLAMALQLQAAQPALRLVWLTRDAADDRWAAAHRLAFCRRDSLRGLWLCLRAGGGFMTHGFSDLRGPAIWGARVVQLWHGAPLKRIGRGRLGRSGRPPGRGRRLVDRLEAYWNSHCTHVVAGSPLAATRLRSAMALPAHKLVVTGDPRMDLLGRDAGAARAALQALARVHGLAGRGRFALLAPTWRDDAATTVVIDAAARSAIAGQQDLVVFIRAHPHSAGIDAFDGLPNVIPLSPQEHRDVTALLAGFDVLLTDYSSIAMDFSVLSRPIVLVAPDLDAYARSPGFYEDYRQFSAGLHFSNWSAGLVALAALCADDPVRARVYWQHSRDMAARYHPLGVEGNAARLAALLFPAGAGR